jgi:hypothetical protein
MDDGYGTVEVIAAVKPYFSGRRIIAHDYKDPYARAWPLTA